MIPEDIKKQLLPELAAPGEDVPKVALPCGLDLKFALDGETISWEEFRPWRVSLREAGEIAGNNAISYIQWVEAEEGVFVNDDSCWPELVLAPATFIEHNYVPGHPVVYVVSESQAILTGSKCQAGLERIRQAMDSGGLTTSAMVLNYDRKTWSRFHVHDATAFDLPGMTITGHATGEGKYKRQTSPPSHYGHVRLEIAPYVGDHDFLLVWAVTEETIPSEFREAVREGIQNTALDSVAETGPMAGIQVTITGGSFHAVDSHAASYRIAAALAFRNALQKVARVPQAERRRERSSPRQLEERQPRSLVIPEEDRVDELRRMGISEPIIRLSEGEKLHRAFEFRCDGPPFYPYHQADPPDGPTFVPLWDYCDTVVGVWKREDGLEFIEYGIEMPGIYDVLARTEQGFLASLFVSFYENEGDQGREYFQEAASLIGFHHLEETFAAYDRSSQTSTEDYEAFVHGWTAHIDQLTTQEKRT